MQKLNDIETGIRWKFRDRVPISTEQAQYHTIKLPNAVVTFAWIESIR
jgi:hypothetical protein